MYEGLRVARRTLAWSAAVVLSVSGAVVINAGAAAAANSGAASIMALDGVVGNLVDRTRANDNDAARVSNSFPVNGILIDQNGKRVPNVNVQVDLHPGPRLMRATQVTDEAAASIPLGLASTDDFGVFTVQVPALKDISDYLTEDGLAELLISSVGPGHSLFYNVQVHLPSNVESRAVVPVADVRVLGASDNFAKTHGPGVVRECPV